MDSNLSLLFAGSGLSIATYREGYIDLVTDTVESGKTIKASGSAFGRYYAMPLGGGLVSWVLCDGDEALFAAPFYSGGRRHRAVLEERNGRAIALFETARFRGAVALSLGTGEDARFFAEAINMMAGRHGASAATVELNCYPLPESVRIFAGESEYSASGPALSERAIVPLASVNRNETASSDLPFARITGVIRGIEKKINPYSRELFWALTIDTAGGTIDALAPRGTDSVLEKASIGNIMEADAYFTCIL